MQTIIKGTILTTVFLLSVGAHATQPYSGDTIRLRSTLPADKAKDAPLNTHVRIELRGGRLSSCGLMPPCESDLKKIADQLQLVTLLDQNGQSIPVKVTIYRTPLTMEKNPYGGGYSVDHRWLVELTPEVALAPNTAHVVRSRLDVDASVVAAVCVDSTEHALLRFTTGAATDDEAPTFDGVKQATDVQFTSEDPSYRDVFQFRQAWFQLMIGSASDASGAVAYNLYRVDASGQHQEILHAWTGKDAASKLTLGHFCSWYTNIMWHTEMDLAVSPGKSTYVVKAVDLAGNEQPSDRQLTVDLSCEVNPPVASAAVEEQGGCSFGQQASSPALGLMLLLPLWVWRRRR
jgi:hypothetical protein